MIWSSLTYFGDSFGLSTNPLTHLGQTNKLVLLPLVK